MIKAYEVNFDGLVGLSHHYGGLSYGNVASLLNQSTPSNPQAAALQGLEKMKLLMDLGIKQAILPPHERPYLPLLRQLGFQGDDFSIISQAYKDSPEILFSCCSAAAMWTANAATVSPSADSLDGKVHITAANLSDKFHRSIEYATTKKILKKIFSNPSHFVHHAAPPPGSYFSDEGAANHNRFCKSHGEKGLQLFVYGKKTFNVQQESPQKFPARQAFEASQAIAKNHQVEHALFAQQNPHAIDAGVFHNDVISLANQNVFLFHEEAFTETDRIIKEIQHHFEIHIKSPFIPIKIKSNQVSLDQAVSTYLFNSQLISLPDATMILVCPEECELQPQIKKIIEDIIAEPSNPIQKAYFLNLHQSMANGGGPACLRLRIVLTEEELKKIHAPIFLTNENYPILKQWIKKNYRDRLVAKDIIDPLFYKETKTALDELTEILNLGSIYDFQQR